MKEEGREKDELSTFLLLFFESKRERSSFSLLLPLLFCLRFRRRLSHAHCSRDLSAR